MTAPVRVHQRPGEFRRLLNLFDRRKPRRVLEIGTYEGGTLYHWLQGRPDVAVTVDDFSMRVDNRSLYDGWVKPGTRLEVVVGNSHDDATFERVREFAPFDWVFIDADHSYEGVSGDWERYRPLATGVVAFHDILPPSLAHPEIQVSGLWAEIKAAGFRTRELVDDPDAPWGGIGVVFINENEEDRLPRYEVTGIPLSPPLAVLAGAKVGDTVTLDLAPDEEKALVKSGAIRKLKEPKAKDASRKQDR